MKAYHAIDEQNMEYDFKNLDTLDFADMNKVHDQLNYLLSMLTLSTKQTLLIKAGVGQI